MGKASYRTIFLAAIAVIVLSMQFFPNQAGTIRLTGIVLAILYLTILAVRTYRSTYTDKRKRAAQEAADSQEYRQYEIELNSIRAKYERSQAIDADERAVIPQEYKDELSALHDKYQAMLNRKFGPGRSPG